MKKVLLIILFLSTFNYSQTVQAGIVNIGNALIIMAKPSANLSGNYSAGVITIRWSSSYTGTVLSSPTASVGSWDYSSTGTIGSYNYKEFDWAGAVFPINWTANNAYELFRIIVTGGTGTGTFELAPNGWLTNSDWYFEVGGNDLTNYTTTYYQSSVSNFPLPVELNSFSTDAVNNSVALKWETKTEVNSNSFVIERAVITDECTADWQTVGEMKASRNSNSPKQYSYLDKNLKSTKYQYRLKMVDNNGTFEYSKISETEVLKPKNFNLSQNYPNPFNPSTKINYTLPFDSKVTVQVYNITGERVGLLVNEEQTAGYYSVDFNSSTINKNISSGVYFYRIIASDKVSGNNFVSIKKMLLLK